MEINKLILKLMWKSKEAKIAKMTWKKNNERIFVLNDKSYYKAIIFKETGCWYRYWQTTKPGNRSSYNGNSAQDTGVIINLFGNKDYSIKSAS